MPRLPSFSLALAGSLVLHGGAVLAVAARAVAESPLPRSPRDAWVGDTFEIDALLEAGAHRGRSAVAPSPAGGEPSRALVEARAPASPPVSLPVALPATGPAIAEARSQVPPALPSRSAAPVGSHRAVAPPAVAVRSGVAAANPQRNGDGSGNGPGVYGAVGEGVGERDLEPAFVRALPAAAASRTHDWLDLVPGTELVARATLELTTDGQLVAVAIAPGAPAPLAALLGRARHLLSRGRFALPPGASAPTPPEYTVTARVGRRSPDPNPFADPGDIMRRGFAVATATAPARAYFTFASGLHVEIEVEKRALDGLTAGGRGAGG